VCFALLNRKKMCWNHVMTALLQSSPKRKCYLDHNYFNSALHSPPEPSFEFDDGRFGFCSGSVTTEVQFCSGSFHFSCIWVLVLAVRLFKEWGSSSRRFGFGSIPISSDNVQSVITTNGYVCLVIVRTGRLIYFTGSFACPRSRH